MKVRELLLKLAEVPLDADVLIEHHDEGSSVPWYRAAYNPTFDANAPYPENQKEHPNGVVVL